ncbi:MAG TPA: outer membrane protein transport protein, partial [Spirochaetota bacterium]|nr:outer membrane protein transport protein [Spirochaetota bacterium]
MMKTCILAVVLVVCFGVFASAAALDNTHMGSKANAMGKAFTGLADDPSAVFYNPAGLVFQREGLSVQTYGLYVMTDLTYTAATFPQTTFGPTLVPVSSTAYENKSDESVLFPGLFLNYHKGDVAVGVGLYVPYGGGKYKYDNYKGLTGMTVEQSLGLMAFGGSMAVRLSDSFSLGVSLTGYMGTYSFKKTLPAGLPAPFVSALGGSVEDDISAVAAVGGNFGLMYKASDSLSFGATAKLPVRITVDGTTTITNTEFDKAAELRLPWYVTLGMALKASPELTITFDFNYALYSSMDKYTFLYRGYPDSNGQVEDVRTGYTDATYFALGADYKASDDLSLRGGVTFTPHATLDDAISLSCDVTHITFALGGAYKFAPEFELTLSLHYLMGIERTITG